VLALIGAFVAGVLTTLAPCVLPLLPVIVGSSVAGPADGGPTGSAAGAGGGVATAARAKSIARRRALVITGSLGISILVFTLALKATTALIGVPPEVWQWVSGGLLIGLGMVALFPNLWERIAIALQLQSRSAAGLTAARSRDGLTGQVLTGAALGPVFTSCSPLYGYVIVTVLPADFGYGLLLLMTYVIGLSGTLLVIALLGQKAVAGARWATDPHGWFRRGLGAIFVLIGVLVITGGMRELEAWILENSPVQPWNLDQGFIPE
jgi:cytochrome c-type biogenesis protein